MVTRALTQVCRATPLPRRATCNLRCSSTISRQPATKPRPKPGDQRPIRDGQTPKPHGQAPKTHGQTSNQFGQASKPYGHKPRPAGAPFKPPKSTSPGTGITPKAATWARAHNVGFPGELKVVKLRSPTDRQGLTFKFAPRQVFRAHHVYDMFTGYEKVGTAYTLYRYELGLDSPLWIHIEGSHSPKPIVRNFARRRVREGIRAALAEKGYTFEGQVAGAGKGEAGGAQNPRKRDLRGTVMIQVQDTVTNASKSKERHIAYGRQVVSSIEEQQSAPRTEPPRRNYRF